MNEQKRAVIGEGGAAQADQQGVMSGGPLQRLAQLSGPARDRHGALTENDLGPLGVAAIGGQRRAHPLIDHPAEDLGRVRRELQLQELLPHFLLAAAKMDDVGGEHAGPGDDGAAEAQQIVHGGADAGAMAEVVAEIDDAVARL